MRKEPRKLSRKYQDAVPKPLKTAKSAYKDVTQDVNTLVQAKMANNIAPYQAVRESIEETLDSIPNLGVDKAKVLKDFEEGFESKISETMTGVQSVESVKQHRERVFHAKLEQINKEGWEEYSKVVKGNRELNNKKTFLTLMTKVNTVEPENMAGVLASHNVTVGDDVYKVLEKYSKQINTDYKDVVNEMIKKRHSFSVG